MTINTTGEAEAKIKLTAVRDWADKARAAVQDPMEIKLIGLAAASAKLAILRSEARRTAAEVSDSGGGGGWLRTLGITGGKLTAGLPGILSSMGPTGIAAAAAAALMLAAALGQVIPPLAAAGIGLAAFGALAMPTFTKVTAAVTALNAATTQQARNQIWAQLPGQIRPVVRAWQDLSALWQKASTALAPSVLAIMNEGLKIAAALLPAIVPIAKTAASAILDLLKGFDRFASSAGFRQFMSQMQALAGPAIRTIGEGIGKIVVALGKALQQMSGPYGIATLSAVFTVIAGAIRGIGLAFEWVGKINTGFAIGMLYVARKIIGGFQFVADVVLNVLGDIAKGTSLLFGWLPGGIGADLRKAAGAFFAFKASVDTSLNGARHTLDGWETALRNAPKIFVLKGDITDLQNKLATAEALLRNPHLTATRRARIEANITQLEIALARARALLAALVHPYSFSVTGTVVGLPSGPPPFGGHKAGGGFAAGMTWVGERGPELVSLPAGSYVHTAAESARVAGGNTYNINVAVPVAANKADIGRAIVEAILEFQKRSGKSWQAA